MPSINLRDSRPTTEVTELLTASRQAKEHGHGSSQWDFSDLSLAAPRFAEEALLTIGGLLQPRTAVGTQLKVSSFEHFLKIS